MIGCFGLTEPDAGSDPGSMRTRARRDGDDWILHGQKMWITNGSTAEVAVVWAQTDEGVRGFVVPKGTPGFTTQDIHGKMSLRASITSELLLDDVRLPADAVLPGVSSLRGPLCCLNEARYGIVWGAAGAARACYEAALSYAWSASSSTSRSPPSRSSSRSWRRWPWRSTGDPARPPPRPDEGRRHPAPRARLDGQARQRQRRPRRRPHARQVLGANGITLEYPVIRHMNNLESVVTYEGTADVHALVIGDAITGISAFR